MPFGLRNAGNTFQLLMDQILGDLPYCFVYVDDILVFSKDLTSHVQHLRDVFLLCREYGLTIGLPKCQFAVEEIEFLGHHLTASGCSPLVKHSAAISTFPQPADKASLQRFLGMVNFYRKFLRSAAQVLAPLTDALKGPGKTISWTPLMDSAFSRAKRLLSSVPELVHPQCNTPISLAVDASDSHIGAVLQQQLLDTSWSPLAFFSKKLSDGEKKYSPFNRELLAAHSSVCHFSFMLEGREFTIFTDHKPLTHALFRSSPPWSAHQQRHLSYLAEFTSSIVHVPGKENVVADALSRPGSPSSAPNPKSNLFSVSPSPTKPCSAPTPESNLSSVSPSPTKPCSNLNPAPNSFQSPSKPVKPHTFPTPGSLPPVVSEVSETTEVSSSFPTVFLTSDKKGFTSALVPAPVGDPSSEPVFDGLDASSLSKFQIACSSVQEIKLNPSLSVIVHPLSSGEVLCDISTVLFAPWFLFNYCLISFIYGVSHPGVRASRKLISSRFVWPGMSRDVGLWTKSCIPCQKSKISTHIHSTVPSIPVPTRRFSHVHVDIVGPIPSSQGYSYLLTMIDRTTRWPEPCISPDFLTM